ncbi:MAG: hypothetical protein ACM3Q2_00575 [Syntrophothermus sp.]
MIQLLSVLAVNIAGAALKYYDLDRFIIIAGFRFHVIALLPFLMLLISRDYREKIREYIYKPSFSHKSAVAAFIFIPVILLTAILFILNFAEIGDPDYFYELGLSSVADFPVYLFWNLPQMLMLALSLVIYYEGKRLKFVLYSLTLLMLIAYELVPFKQGGFQIMDAAAAVSAVLILSAFLAAINNIYFFAISAFSVLWSNILLYGSSSKMLIKIFLAGNYEQWEGFLKLNKSISPYQLLLHLGIIAVLFIIPFIIVSVKKRDAGISKLQVENTND